MDDDDLALLIAPLPGAVPVTTPLSRRITTVGSAPEADVRLSTVAPQWGVVRREPNGVTLRILGSTSSHLLRPGEAVTVDGVSLTLTKTTRESASTERIDAKGLPMARLSEVLSEARSAEDAVRALLRETVQAADADSGAIILREGDDYRIALVVDKGGEHGGDAALLLSDTVVRDALRGGEPVRVADARQHARYAHVPSVTALSLRAVLCVPMTLYGRVVGAIFLGKRAIGQSFGARVAGDLAVVASMAVPLLSQLRRADATVAATADEDGLFGDSEAMVDLRRLVARVGASDLGVLVLGETGTGKELIARALHRASARRGRPLVAINCSAIAENLLQSELFGHKKGAFTGALADRPGRIEQAHGSTLFLDEVGDMPLAMQAAMLRVLEQREVMRVGENVPRSVDFRLVAATHKDLDVEVKQGRFREDLLYRLREVAIAAPPLRTRGDDVVLLAHVFLRETERQLGLRAHRLDDGARALLLAHPWPGNVRELRAAMRRAAVLADEGAIRPKDLQLGARPSAPPPATTSSTSDPPAELGDLARPLADAKEDFVARYVRAVLARCGGDRTIAAQQLGVSVRSIYRYLPPE